MDFVEEGFFEDDAQRESVLDTPLSQQPLLARLIATEGFNRPFLFELTIVSHRRKIETSELLGKTITASIRNEALEDGPFRHFHGQIVGFDRRWNDKFVSNEMYVYELALRPWLWLLTMRKNCRIFQKLTSLEIIKDICDEHGFGDLLDDAGVTKKGKLQKREYCVQYNESDFAFVSRLLEEEGIYYYFEHERTKHKLMLADDPSVHVLQTEYDGLVQYARTKFPHYQVHSWNEAHRVHAKSYQLDDYDYLAPMRNLKVKLQGPQEFVHEFGTQYEYPGRYVEESVGNDYVSRRMEEHNAPIAEVSGSWSLLGPPAGSVFTLMTGKEEYLLTGARSEYLYHDPQGRNPMPQEQPLDTSVPIGIAASFTAIPKTVPFRPARVTPKPVIAGVQTGMVVGETADVAEGTIETDEHGRVYVRMHWYDEDTEDQEKSCWMRVSQPWAGNGWGGQFIPRVGQEVVVAYVDGDPDRPLIVGSVYNGLNSAPFPLPDGTISGFKTDRGVHGEVTEKEPNLLQFDDGKGQVKMGGEKVNIYGKGDPQSAVAINGGMASIDVGGLMQSIGMQAPKSTSVVSGMEISAIAGMELTFSSATSFIKIDPTGITLFGPMITLNTPVLQANAPVFTVATIPLPGPPAPIIAQKVADTVKDAATALAQLGASATGIMP